MSVWYPYAQMKTVTTPLKVKSAQGCRLILEDGSELIDGISSWWSVIHGYNHPKLNKALKTQCDQMAHVMLGGLTHDPAIQLANKLTQLAPNGLNHVFYGDSGSVGVEIALKMALQFWKNSGQSQKHKMACLYKSYHGDTTGCMSVCDPVEGMHHLFAENLMKHYFIPAPNAEAIEESIDQVETVFKAHHHEIAAFIVEPILQAAGGFNIYPSVYLKEVRRLCDHYDILLIADEVATGFGRTGALFAVNHADISPDIMVLGKGLTAGYLGHSATLATDRIFNAFWSDDPHKAFMHGPTFMGNPLACAVALESIRLFEEEESLNKIAKIEKTMQEELLTFTHPDIKDIRVIGAVAVIEVNHESVLKESQEKAAQQGVWLRSFGTYLYTMPPYIVTESELKTILTTMKNCFE